MEKTTLDALNWQLSKGASSSTQMNLNLTLLPIGDVVSAADHSAPHHTTLHVRRRFQFSSALKRMSTICTLPNGRNIIAVKGAPETIKGMLTEVPSFYDATFQRFTRSGSRVLALAFREVDNLSTERVGLLLSSL